MANGGIGATYSNVMLGGVNSIADSGAKVPPSEYMGNYLRNGVYANDQKHANLSPDNFANQSHKHRWVHNAPTSMAQGQNSSQNNLAYVKGVDFNSQQKYDFNILNHKQHEPGNVQGNVSKAFSPPERSFNYGLPGFHK